MATQNIFPDGPPSVFTEDAGGAMAASALAPVIYFDLVSMAGINAGGVAHLTFEMVRHMAALDTGQPMKDCIVTAHVRCDLNGLSRLKAAIESIEALAAPPGPSVSRN